MIIEPLLAADVAARRYAVVTMLSTDTPAAGALRFFARRYGYAAARR